MPEDIANLFSHPHSLSLSLSLSIGTCVLAFASLILPTTCSVPICLVGLLFSHPSFSSTLPGVKVQTWRKVVSTNRSGQHLHLHFHLHLHLRLLLSFLSTLPFTISIFIRNVLGLPFYAWSHRWLASGTELRHVLPMSSTPRLCGRPDKS